MVIILTTISIKVDDNFEGKDFITSFSGDGTLYETKRFRDSNREMIYNHYIPRLLEYIIPHPYDLIDATGSMYIGLYTTLQSPEVLGMVAPKNVNRMFWRRMCDRMFELDVLRSTDKKDMNNSFLMRMLLFIIYGNRNPDFTVSQMKKIDVLASKDSKLRIILAKALYRNIFKPHVTFYYSFFEIVPNINVYSAYSYIRIIPEIFNHGNPYSGYLCDGGINRYKIVNMYIYGRYLQDKYLDYAVTGTNNKFKCNSVVERMILIAFCILHPNIGNHKGYDTSLLFRLYTEEFIPNRGEFEEHTGNILEAYLGIYFLHKGGDYKKFFMDKCEEDSYILLTKCKSESSAFDSFERFKGWDDHYVSASNIRQR